MRFRVSTARLCISVASCCLLGCGPSEPAPAASAPHEESESAPSKPSRGDDSTGSLFLEESSAEFYVELSRSKSFAIETYTSLRFIPWRRVTAIGSDVEVRMSLGYGIGVSADAIDHGALAGESGASKNEQDFTAAIFKAMNNFDERATFQLNRTSLRSIIRFVENMEKVELRDPPSHVANRFVQGAWGDLLLQRTDGGMFVSIAGSGWEPFSPERFKAAVRRAMTEMERLEAGTPSARW